MNIYQVILTSGRTLNVQADKYERRANRVNFLLDDRVKISFPRESILTIEEMAYIEE
jgi:hypothetical protein